jgi:succinate dehydrogenase/fumarate reductase-like Fe-S protein
MEQDHMGRLNDLIVEMEQFFGPIRDYQPYLIDVSSVSMEGFFL